MMQPPALFIRQVETLEIAATICSALRIVAKDQLKAGKVAYELFACDLVDGAGPRANVWYRGAMGRKDLEKLAYAAAGAEAVLEYLHA